MTARVAGKRDVLALLSRDDRKVQKVLLSDKLPADAAGEIQAAAGEKQAPVEVVASDVVDKAAGRLMSGGILGIYERPPAMTLAELMSESKAMTRQPLLLVLDALSEHKDLESLLRIGLLSGAVGLVRVAGKGGPLPDSVKAQLLLSEVPDLVPALDELRTKHKLWVLGVQKDALDSVYEMELDWAMAVVFGGEGQSLRPELAACCDVLAKIPLGNDHAPVSEPEKCAVLLYDLMRQRLAWASRGQIKDVLWESDAKKKRK